MLDLFRAWRHVSKYVIGLIVSAELYVLWAGPESIPEIRREVERLFYGDANVVLSLAVLALLAVAGSLLAGVLIELPHTLLGGLTQTLLRRRQAAGTALWKHLLWLEIALAYPGKALQLVVQSDREYLARHLRVASLSNVAKDRPVDLKETGSEYFEQAIATILASTNHELLWGASYAAQFTQERRELDAFETEAAIASSVAVAASLFLGILLQFREVMAWVGFLAGLLAGSSAILWALRSWFEARRRRVYYMTGLIIQGYMWGEQGQMEDRDSV